MPRLHTAIRLGVLIAIGVASVLLSLDAGGYYPEPTALSAVCVLAVLAFWLMIKPAAYGGPTRAGWIIAGLLAAYTGWTLLSSTWSHSTSRALIEFDRDLLYLAVFVLFASLTRGRHAARLLVVVLTVASLAIALVGLAAWLLPDHFPVAALFERRRMSYPTGYWNTTGLAGAFGCLWALHLSCAVHEHRLLRVLGAATVVPTAAVVAFTGSRGAAGAALIGAVSYALATRSRRTLPGLATAGLGAGLAVAISLRAPQLATRPVSAVALAQGHRTALWLTACFLATAVLRTAVLRVDRVLGARVVQPVRRARWIGLAACLVLIGAGAAAGLPRDLHHAYSQFNSGPVDNSSGTAHFASLSGDGRTQLWHIALHWGFEPAPLRGSGAGTFANLWLRHRTAPGDVLVAHSLYLGTLGDLGAVGAALLFAALLQMAILIGLRSCGARSSAVGQAWAGLLASTGAWLVFAAVDWNWQMPSVTVWLFASAGLAASRESAAQPSSRSRHSVAVPLRRGCAAIGALLLCIVPLHVARGTAESAAAVSDLQRRDCVAALRQARDAHAVLPSLASADMVLAYCNARAGRDHWAERDAANSVRADPGDWEPYYTMALVRAVAGVSPRSAALAALARDPLGSYAIEAARLLGKVSPAQARVRALALPIPLAVDDCGGPTPAGQLVPCGNPQLPSLAGGLIPTKRP